MVEFLRLALSCWHDVVVCMLLNVESFWMLLVIVLIYYKSYAFRHESKVNLALFQWNCVCVCVCVCVCMCMCVCSHLCTRSGTNIWLYTNLSAPRDLSVPILVPIILNLSICEKCWDSTSEDNFILVPVNRNIHIYLWWKNQYLLAPKFFYFNSVKASWFSLI